jgi:predicted Zn-dependent protease
MTLQATTGTRADALMAAADAVAASLRSRTDYAQVFAESTREVRKEIRDGIPRATLVELRHGFGCLVRAGGVWRYRHFTDDELPALASWVPGGAAPAVRLDEPVRKPLPPLLPYPDQGPGTVLEDHVVRTFAVADTDGVRELSHTESLRRRAEVRLVSDGVAGRGFSRWAGTAEGSSSDEASPRTLSWQAARRAGAAAAARSWGRRRSDVVFAPSAGAGLLHELVGHALEADNAARQSQYVQTLMRPGAVPQSLLLVDDPTLDGGYGSYRVDDEGCPARRRTMVAGGSVRLLTSLRSAGTGEPARTGNGRRQDYRFPALPRTSNTVVPAGTDDDVDVAAPAAGGVLVVGSLGAGEINLATGEFVFAALDAYVLTADGTPEPARNVALVGNAVDLLQRLLAVGRQPGGDNVTCGKQGQFLPIGIYSPVMRFADMDWTAA